jgi:hypothetical protein
MRGCCRRRALRKFAHPLSPGGLRRANEVIGVKLMLSIFPGRGNLICRL